MSASVDKSDGNISMWPVEIKNGRRGTSGKKYDAIRKKVKNRILED